MTHPLTARLPIIPVTIKTGRFSLRKLDDEFAKKCEPWPRAIPKEITVKALIDSGASVSILDDGLVEKMRLQVTGYCPITGFNSLESTRCPNYDVGYLFIDHENESELLRIEIGQIVGQPISNERFDAIIGMDVLKHCVFTVNGPDDSFTLEAPHAFVEEVSSVSISKSKS